ncbi:LegC family aminotransferase [Clostridium formicaceticum]|uniref:Perosamine synthetase n=1 Tax=Clostridium formicaceticum TaxID=1497 RepID=A0AAC9WES9_9CLOT|nr:LegC family aminotransferase [Clostridium formicaceticum]AOY75649.1 perosamine synthetase [Clostridium formicaceticum]ARE85963.1 Putative pyridoxal phosphate-dependent aminotransferase EpsN [Clostridium formicaceticum]
MIPLAIPNIAGNEWRYIKECLDTNWVSSVGSYVDLFEEKFREYLSTQKAVATMNGTAAITLALQTLGIGAGDEVIVPSMTFVASVNPVVYVGANPVFIDITPDTWVMDVDMLEERITEKTKAIIPVHVYGNMVDMEPLLKIAKKYHLYVIEDATEALGSEYRTSDGKWHKAGTLGNFGTFSFNGNKLITTGAGGMLVTHDVDLGEKAKHLCNQAKTTLPNGDIVHEEIGYNYRMPNILAAMGVAQLEKIEEYILIKIKNAKLYHSYLQNIEGIRLPKEKENVKHVHWLYSILIEENYGSDRDELIKKLNERGIGSRGFFQPIHTMRPYADYSKGAMNNTYRVSKRGVNLPSSVSLSSKDCQYICNTIHNIHRGCL